MQDEHGRVVESGDDRSPSRKSMRLAPDVCCQSRSFEIIRILAQSFSDIPPHLAEFSLGFTVLQTALADSVADLRFRASNGGRRSSVSWRERRLMSELGGGVQPLAKP